MGTGVPNWLGTRKLGLNGYQTQEPVSLQLQRGKTLRPTSQGGLKGGDGITQRKHLAKSSANRKP